MNSHQRRIAIYDRLVSNKTVEVNDLALEFQVSTMTIRRDLLLFEKQGLVTTTYGGAYLNQGMTAEASFSLKTTQMIKEKISIGHYAATLINENDTIIIDSGSTTLQLAKNIPNVKLTVITNSWPIVNFLGNNNKVKLILAPGEYNSVSAGVLDSKTIAFFNSLNADKAFLSTQAFDFKRGLTVPDPIDAEVKKSMLNAAKSSYLLLDHSKIGQTYLSKHAELIDFDQVIVDKEIDNNDYQKLAHLNPNIIKV
ncbi:MAG: DeoR/GlpR family DNA-binding transcription regulator [Erysipelotrichaceae bacterium]|nr:DeoR/GlpR family DNA-binding transcription regulator [Erysipelotrichaceae bacterium]